MNLQFFVVIFFYCLNMEKIQNLYKDKFTSHKLSYPFIQITWLLFKNDNKKAQYSIYILTTSQNGKNYIFIFSTSLNNMNAGNLYQNPILDTWSWIPFDQICLCISSSSGLVVYLLTVYLFLRPDKLYNIHISIYCFFLNQCFFILFTIFKKCPRSRWIYWLETFSTLFFKSLMSLMLTLLFSSISYQCNFPHVYNQKFLHIYYNNHLHGVSFLD